MKIRIFCWSLAIALSILVLALITRRAYEDDFALALNQMTLFILICLLTAAIVRGLDRLLERCILRQAWLRGWFADEKPKRKRGQR